MPLRSIFIGDVHGCARELERLLEAVQWSSSDRVYFVGDLVARGPKSSAVLRIFRRIQAQGVLGNHEDRLLEARDARRAGRPGPHLSPSHEHLMTRFSDKDWALLEALPLSLDVPEHDVRIVHAGVVPGVPLAQQQRRDLLKMRALEPDG
ncbi:MAG TPA: metallophosphoesterase, partial [Polyangiaceae bacterium]|nr:metallophosphoesterase [Polyangiaceae bacterium]